VVVGVAGRHAAARGQDGAGRDALAIRHAPRLDPRAAGRGIGRWARREQPAQIAQDYYNDKNGNPTEWGGTVATLQPFVDEMRKGDFGR
jgi:hypothetical protein